MVSKDNRVAGFSSTSALKRVNLCMFVPGAEVNPRNQSTTWERRSILGLPREIALLTIDLASETTLHQTANRRTLV